YSSYFLLVFVVLFFETLEKLHRRSRPILSLLRQSGENRLFKFRRKERIESGERQGLGLDMCKEPTLNRIGMKRRRPGQHFEDYYAERVDIRALIEFRVGTLFRSEILNRPHNHSGLRYLS